MSPIKKTLKVTYVFTAIVILLAVYVYVFEKDEKNSGNSVKIFNIGKDDLKRFEIINNQTNEKVVCEKSGTDAWNMVKPKQYEMEKTEVDGIVSNLTSLSVDRKLDGADNLASFGLDKPEYIVDFVSKDGKKYSLQIGLKTPTETYYYVKDAAQKAVYTAYAFSVESLKKGVKELRKKTILDITAEKTTKLNIKFEKKELEFLKESENNWFVMPYRFKGDKDSIENLIYKLSSLKAAGFIEDEPSDLKKYGLDKPVVSISVHQGSDRPSLTLQVGKKLKDKDEDFVKRTDVATIFSVEHNFATNFDKTYNDFRDKRLFVFKSEDILEVEIIKEKKRIYAKKDRLGKFKVEEPVKKLVEYPYSSLISEVSSLKVNKFVDDSGKKLDKYGLKNPKITITLYAMENQEKKIKAKLYIGNADKEDYYAKTDTLDSVYSISKYILDKINDIEKAMDKK